MSKNAEPSGLTLFTLLAIITSIYIMFIIPFATGAYYALKDGNYKEFSDGLIEKVRSKLKIF